MKELRQKIRLFCFTALLCGMAGIFFFRCTYAETALAAEREARNLAARGELTEYTAQVVRGLSGDGEPAVLFAAALLGRAAVPEAVRTEEERASLRRFFSRVLDPEEQSGTALRFYALALLDALESGEGIPYFPEPDAKEVSSPPSVPMSNTKEEKTAREIACALLGKNFTPARLETGEGYCYACTNACVRIRNGKVCSFVRQYAERETETLTEEQTGRAAEEVLKMCGYDPVLLVPLGKKNGSARYRGEEAGGKRVTVAVSLYSGMPVLLRAE